MPKNDPEATRQEPKRKLRWHPQPNLAAEGYTERFRANHPGLIEAMGSVE